MGLFDSITIHDALPSTPEMEKYEISAPYDLQTKCLGAGMAHYLIENGILYQKKWEINVWVEGDPNAKSLRDQIGYMKRENPYLEVVDFTGTMTVYNLIFNEGSGSPERIWVEWDLALKSGLVVSAFLVKFEPKDDLEGNSRIRELLDPLPAPSKQQVLWDAIRMRFYSIAGWVANLGRLF